MQTGNIHLSPAAGATVSEPSPPLAGAFPAVRGIQSRLACKCSRKNDVDFLVREDRIVCAYCGLEVFCAPPIVGVYTAACSCCVSPAVKSTFILDSNGVYTCTWCGRVR